MKKILIAALVLFPAFGFGQLAIPHVPVDTNYLKGGVVLGYEMYAKYKTVRDTQRVVVCYVDTAGAMETKPGLLQVQWDLGYIDRLSFYDYETSKIPFDYVKFNYLDRNRQPFPSTYIILFYKELPLIINVKGDTK